MIPSKDLCIDKEIAIISECIRKNIPFVCYRLPETENINIAIQTIGEVTKIYSYDELKNKEGFLISNFGSDPVFCAWLLQPNYIFPDLRLNQDILQDIIKNLPEYTINNKKILPIEISQEGFLQQVKEIKSHIQEGEVKKVVLSRISLEPRTSHQSPACIFLNLCQYYPEAFVYLLKIPEIGFWMGATPEPFLVINLSTAIIESIAGTQSLNNRPIDAITWGKKEIEEQEIVTNFIEEKFKELNITHFQKTGPITTQAGQLVHLQTRFKFKSDLIENNIQNFLKVLYPTPSVCGTPPKKAYEYITQTELHRRECYTGILGPLNLKGITALFANIRCMQVFDEAFCLYLGAGITAASIPEREWEETNLKKNTLLSAIRSIP